MKISDYNIQSMSEHKLEQSTQVTENLTVWRRQQQPADQIRAEEPSYRIELDHFGEPPMKAEQKFVQEKIDTESYIEHEEKMKLKLIESFIYHTTGRMIRLTLPTLDMKEEEGVQLRLPGDIKGKGQPPPVQLQGVGVEYDYREVFEEVEQVQFRSTGSVTTSSGKQYHFDLQFNMSRRFYQENNVSVRLGDAVRVDPLVVAYGGSAPELTDTRHAFDIDADGKTEQVSMPGVGSGFLAIDKNGNGRIDDGSELFGPESGNGFQELRAYDADSNDWIDEADIVFDELRIMTVDEEGKQSLFKLGEMGIGAIFLDEVATQFGIKDGAGDKGLMRTSSIFLKEDGRAGTIHHIDLSL